jgi:hypothetical protein
MNSINLIRRLFLAMIMMGLLSGCETFSGYDMEAVNRKTVTVEAARVEFASGDSVRWGVLSQNKKAGHWPWQGRFAGRGIFKWREDGVDKEAVVDIPKSGSGSIVTFEILHSDAVKVTRGYH